MGNSSSCCEENLDLQHLNFNNKGCCSCGGNRGCCSSKCNENGCFSCGAKHACCGNTCYCCVNDHYQDIRDDFGYCMITLKKKVYQPGESMEGSLYLKLFSDYEAKDIKLNFAGFEEFLCYDVHNEDHKFAEKNFFFDNLYSVQNFNRKVLRGDYRFDFKIKLDSNLSSSYSYKYKTKENKAFTKVKYVLVGGVINNNGLEGSLLSNKLEVYIENNKNYEQASHLKDMVSLSKGCSKVATVKGEIKYKNEKEKYLYGNVVNDFVLKLDNTYSKIDFEVEIILKGIKEIKYKDENFDFEHEFYKSVLGKIEAKKSKDFDFFIPIDTIGKAISTINSESLVHNFYFEVLLKNNKNRDLMLQLPVIIKNSKPNTAKFDEKKYFYFKGNQYVFEKNFHPINRNLNVELSEKNLEKNCGFYKKYSDKKIK